MNLWAPLPSPGGWCPGKCVEGWRALSCSDDGTGSWGWWPSCRELPSPGEAVWSSDGIADSTSYRDSVDMYVKKWNWLWGIKGWGDTCPSSQSLTDFSCHPILPDLLGILFFILEESLKYGIFKKCELSICKCVLLIHTFYRTLVDRTEHVCGLDATHKLSSHHPERVGLRCRLDGFLILPLPHNSCGVSCYLLKLWFLLYKMRISSIPTC